MPPPAAAELLPITSDCPSGRALSDEWTVPLCAAHHRALHTVGDEEKWWNERQVDPIIHAEQLWRERRGETIQQPSRARELINPGLS
jgi:hypothetical protein